MANVNVPTDLAQKEKDVNAKLQLYGIYSAFSNGKVPSNQQIDVALNSALASRALSSPSSKLSTEGKELVADLREVIKQAKILLLTKNHGNVLQDFIWQAQNIDGANAALPGAPISKDTAQQHGQDALNGLKTLGTLLLSNGQFRKLISDASVLIRDMAGDAAQNAANKVNPSEEQLKQIDKPAEDNTWHEVPDLSAQNLKTQARAAVDNNKPFSSAEAKEAANRGIDAARAQGTNQEAGQAGLQAATGHLQDRAQQNVSDEDQEKAQRAKDAAVQKTKNYLSKKMPEERREQTIWRLKKMIVEIQGHSDYQQAIETLLNLAEEYGGHAKSVSAGGAGTLQDAHNDTNLQIAERDLKTLLERFANSTSMDDLFDSVNQIYRDADRDPELKNWFTTLNRYIRKCLKEQGYILKDESTEEWNRIYDKGQFLLRERYRDHTDRIVDEIKFLADQYDADPHNRAFGDAVQKLFLNLGNDENGQTTFKPHLVKDVFEVIIPAIFENTRYVPIPRIEASDPMVDVVVENLVVESDNLFPNVLELSTDNYFRMGRRQISSKRDNKIMIAASGIQCDLRDVAYYIKKKQGFPSITDKGVMDITLAGEGFSFKLAGRNAQPKDRTHFFVVDKVDVQVKNLNIKLKKSNHKLLFGIAKPLLLKVMRPVIQKVIEKQIKQTAEDLDGYLYGIHQEAQRAAKAAANDPENAPNIYSQYVTAFQNKIGEKQKKAEQTAKDTKVNVAVTQHDSMFKNIQLPGGISTKATEYKDLAAKGDKWESPVFSIGSARESSDIPKPTSVTRKPHQTRAGGIRGGNHPNANTESSNIGYGSTTAGLTGAAGTGYGNTGLSDVTSGTGLTQPSMTTANTSAPGFGNQLDAAFNSRQTDTAGSATSGLVYDNVTTGR